MVSSCGPDVHAPFPFLQTFLFFTGVWLRGDSYFANTCMQTLAGSRSSEQTACQGKSNRVPQSYWPPRWSPVSPAQEDRGGGGVWGMKGGARKKEGHTLLRLITGTSAEQWPLCVYMRRIISDKAILPPSSSSCPLVATLPALFLCFLFALRGLCPDERQSR